MATLKKKKQVRLKHTAEISFLEEAVHAVLPVHRPNIKRETDSIFINFVNSKPFPVWIADKKCNLVYANSAFYFDFNIDKEPADKDLNKLLPASRGNLLFQKHVQILGTGTMQTLQQKILSANNVEQDFLINLFLFTDTSGNKMIGGEAIKKDDRYQQLAKLQKPNESLLEPSHRSSSANWEWNMVTNHIYRNDVMQDLTGFSNRSSKNLSWWFSRIHPADCKQVRESIKNILKNQGHNWESEYRFKHKTGTYITVRDRALVI